MEAIRINDFRLYREITDGKKHHVHDRRVKQKNMAMWWSPDCFCWSAVVDRETDELIEKAIAFKLAYRQQYQQKAGWN